MPSTILDDFLLNGKELDRADANYITHRILSAASGKGETGESFEGLRAEVRRTLAICYSMDVPGSLRWLLPQIRSLPAGACRSCHGESRTY